MFFFVTFSALTCADVTQALDRVVTFNYLVPGCLQPLDVSAAFSLQSSRGNISRVILRFCGLLLGFAPKWVRWQHAAFQVSCSLLWEASRRECAPSHSRLLISLHFTLCLFSLFAHTHTSDRRLRGVWTAAGWSCVQRHYLQNVQFYDSKHYKYIWYFTPTLSTFIS